MCLYAAVYCCLGDCSGPRFSCSFFRMALGDFGINLTENKGKNDTNITTVNPCTEDYNYTSSPNQTAFIGDHQPQDEATCLQITIAMAILGAVLFVIGVIVVKKRNWFREKMMGMIGVLTKFTCIFRYLELQLLER